MHPIPVYISMTFMTWMLLQILTSPESQTIFTAGLAKYTSWIYLVLGAIVAALVMYLPILFTGTIAVAGIGLSLFLHHIQRNATLNIISLTDKTMDRLIGNNAEMQKVRVQQFNRARQNYGIITTINNTTYAFCIMTMSGLLLAAFFRMFG